MYIGQFCTECTNREFAWKKIEWKKEIQASDSSNMYVNTSAAKKVKVLY